MEESFRPVDGHPQMRQVYQDTKQMTCSSLACATPSGPHTRKPEVIRTTFLSLPTSANLGGSTPSQKQTVSWSGPIDQLLGYHLDDIECTEDWWLNQIHPDDRPEILSSLAAHLVPTPDNLYNADARIWGNDYRLRHSQGHYVLVSDRSITTRDVDGIAFSLVSVIFDKEKRNAQRKDTEKLMHSQNHLATIADNTPSGIFMMDPQGYTTYMNTAAEQITGFTYEEIYDYTFHASVHSCRPNGDVYPLHECPVFRHQQQGTAAKNESEVFVHKDGHHYDIVYSVSPIGDYASGGSVIEFRDVTDEKRIERERLNALLMNEQQSIQIKESAAHKANMTSFVSFVCHELRNPLQGVTSSAEFLADTLEKLEALTGTLASLKSPRHDERRGSIAGLEPVPTVRSRSTGIVEPGTLIAMEGLITYAKELVSNISTCASHQALITNNVLDLSRLDAGKVELSYDVIDVEALGRQIVSMMASRAQVKAISLSMAEPGNPPLYLKADATILSQVLLNLVSNAIKFTPEKGTIRIDLYADAPNEDGQITLHGSVTDNGLGMTDVEQQRLFQRFSQANRKVAQLYGGSGLGLSISKELVRVMGGEMHVKSAQGKGSTFSFTSLHDSPTRKELVEFLRESNSPRDGMIPGTVNNMAETAPQFQMICVAEDNPINLKHLAKNLTVLGYQHVLCTNGQEALDKFREPDSTIDAVIIDMSMPVMDGLEATRLMREHELSRHSSDPAHRRTPIIALSGNALKDQIDEAMAMGTSDYLIKPCKKADLAKTLSYWEHVVHSGAPHKALFDKRQAF